MAGTADKTCYIRSMHTDAVNHAPAQILMNTGSQQFGRPSLGAWTLYGLGSMTKNLPGYVVLASAKGPAAAPATTARASSRLLSAACLSGVRAIPYSIYRIRPASM